MIVGLIFVLFILYAIGFYVLINQGDLIDLLFIENKTLQRKIKELENGKSDCN